MNEKLISGKVLSDEILADIKTKVEQVSIRKPCLAVVLVGDDPASHIYVKNKKNACAKVGFISIEHKLSSDTTQEELLQLVDSLNQDHTVDGILVQLPLPKHLDSKLIINTILPNKDVDGFHKYNVGSLTVNEPNLCPCTPHGVMYMLDSLNVNYHGKRAVIIGASNIVGRPMALELLNRGATITVCNSKTIDLAKICREADILVVALGKPKYITSDYIKPGSIVIDVGINRLDDGTLCGDVDFSNVINVASHITPVPGGVGPMTIAMLMKNTLHCYNLNIGNK